MIINEPVATPGVLQDRQKAELEDSNERGQVLLSVKNIGELIWLVIAGIDCVDEKYRAMFPFEKFNPMQSKALDDVGITCRV
jgi:hypothetical protein